MLAFKNQLILIPLILFSVGLRETRQNYELPHTPPTSITLPHPQVLIESLFTASFFLQSDVPGVICPTCVHLSYRMPMIVTQTLARDHLNSHVKNVERPANGPRQLDLYLAATAKNGST